MKKFLITAAAILTPAYFAFSGGDGSVHHPVVYDHDVKPVAIDIKVDKDGEMELDIDDLSAYELDQIVSFLAQMRPLDVEVTLPGDLEDEFENSSWIGPNGEILDSPLVPVVETLAHNGVLWEDVKVD